jgi:hypothetical protein
MSAFKKTRNIVANILIEVQYSGTGSFWCPPSSTPDLGYMIPSRVRPSDSKAIECNRNPKNKEDTRSRHLFL